MNRREVFRSLALGGVGATALPSWVENLGRLASERSAAGAMASQGAGWAPRVFTPRQNEAVIALAELIIPRTDSAGATEARVNEFIDTVLDDAPRAERRQFLSGLTWLDARSGELFGADFVDAARAQQEAILTVIADETNEASADIMGVEFFQAMKRLTVTGYYTSEAGMREELGDTGNLAFADDPGCLHPEHKS